MHHRLPDWAMRAIMLLLLVAASFPIYARITHRYKALGLPLSLGSHFLAVIASSLAGIVVVFLILAVQLLFVLAVDYLRQKFRL